MTHTSLLYLEVPFPSVAGVVAEDSLLQVTRAGEGSTERPGDEVPARLQLLLPTWQADGVEAVGGARHTHMVGIPHILEGIGEWAGQDSSLQSGSKQDAVGGA